MAGNFDFLHIKRRTAGSSNELSFDVLDHKSAEADGKANRASRTLRAPKASQGSYHGVAGSSTLSGQAEVEKRKKARRTYRIRLQVIGLVAVVALVAVGAVAGLRYYESQVNTTSRIHELVDRLTEVDETLVDIDEMMIDPFDADVDADARAAALSEMPDLTTRLNRISVDAQSLLEAPLSKEEEVVVHQISDTAQARNGMIMAAADAFRLADEAAEQVNRANQVWNGVINADQEAREAISAANKATTQEATTAALEQTRQAADGFAEALDGLRDIESAYDIDFSEEEAYLEKKMEALQKAIETSEALLAGNREVASEASKAYNAADLEAVSLANALPPSMGDLVQARFDEMMLDVAERYAKARYRTVSADSVIRDYLQ